MPQYLYKYESFNAQTLQNLKSQILYFGSPLQFNDPYDCAITPNFAPPTDEDIEVIRTFYLNLAATPSLQRHQLMTFNTQQLREMLLRAGAAAIGSSIAQFLSTRGVTCFSERNDDLLMWSHYGGRYRGLCLEFDVTADGLQKIQQVRYVSRPPLLSLKSILVDRDYDHVVNLFCTKSEAWAYEREWRAIHKQAGTEYVYPVQSLTGIYFGPDINPQALEIVCLILRGQNKGVRLWRGRRSTEEFRVLFEEFTYTTFLEAKETGQR